LKPSSKIYVVSLLGIATVSTAHLLWWENKKLLNLFSDIVIQALFFILVVLALTLTWKYGWSWKEAIPRIWLLASQSVILCFIGGVTWVAYIYWLGLAFPYPSLADWFFLAGILLAIAAVAHYVKTFRESLRREALIAVLTIIALSTALFFFYVLSSVVASPAHPMEKALTVVYGVVDISLFSLALVGLAIFFGEKIGESWFLLCLGLALITVGDLLFFSMVTLSFNQIGGFANMLTELGLILLALSFYIHKREL
jgi:hypothetical protein